ncbi:MAG: DUF512 domain-containing protein [Candidatus Glassbacteria bacterium]
MLKVTDVESGSPAESAGFRPGDRILSVNGRAVEDHLDFYFHAADYFLRIGVNPAGSRVRRELILRRKPGRALGLAVDEGRVKRCRNRCIFCFVDQLPRGLRRSLYVRDEDYRHSFLYGNFITGGNLQERDVDRIVRMRLSPLYVSLHASDPQVRKRLLGGCGPADVMPLLARLTEAGIGIHGQVVLCPGINDRAVLAHTIEDFAGLGESALSLAVVPVGLTGHRQTLAWIEPVGPPEARVTLRLVHRFQRRFLAERRTRLVFAADEFYLRAGARLPSAAAYEDYPQIENGVGLVRRSLEEIRRLMRRKKFPAASAGARIRIATGRLFAPVVRERIISRLPREVAGCIDVTAVDNRLLGESVTVAGLLSGRDILAALHGAEKADVYLLPAAAVNQDGRFLDDITLEEVKRELEPARVVVEESLIAGIASALETATGKV